MEIKCTVEELKELIKEKRTSVAVTTDEIPPHEFPLFDFREYHFHGTASPQLYCYGWQNR